MCGYISFLEGTQQPRRNPIPEHHLNKSVCWLEIRRHTYLGDVQWGSIGIFYSIGIFTDPSHTHTPCWNSCLFASRYSLLEICLCQKYVTSLMSLSCWQKQTKEHNSNITWNFILHLYHHYLHYSTLYPLDPSGNFT